MHVFILSGHHVFLKGLYDVSTDKVTCFVVAYKLEDVLHQRLYNNWGWLDISVGVTMQTENTAQATHARRRAPCVW